MSDDSPELNTGAASTLVSSSAPGAASYLKFMVSGIPAGRYVTAHLVLHRAGQPLPPTLTIGVTSSSWSELAINAANAPSIGTPVASPRLASNAMSVSADVTSAVKINGFYTFSVTDPVAGSVASFYSRQSRANAPTLVVNYSTTRPADQPVITPTPTPTPTTPTPTPTASPTDPTTTPTPTPTTTPTPTPTPVSDPPSNSGCTVSPILVSSCGVWWGIGPNPLGSESWDQSLVNFENQQGRLDDVLHYYHVGAGLFPTGTEIMRSKEGPTPRLLMENWKPELGHTWAQVAAGVPAVDQEIDNEANYLKTQYTSKFFLSIHHEPENEVIPTAGSGYTAADYAAMYRHVVLRLKADGVTNAVFVMDYMGYKKWGEQSWFSQLYPGDDVVDWIAYDPYSTGSGTFATMVNDSDGTKWPGFYTWATTVHPGKPLMLAEWGVTEVSGNPNGKANFFNTMPTYEQQFPAIKALLYWNASSYPTRIDSSPQSLAAFRQLAQNPLYNPPLP